jgi:putative redox protein
MKATAVWQGNMSFTGKADSGFPVLMNSVMNMGETPSGPSPMELIAMGLAGCTGMDVISILRKKQQDVTQFEVQVDAPRASEHPKVFTSAVINYVIKGHAIEEDAVLRALELSYTKYCPAQIMLGQAFPIDLTYEIFEDEGDGSERLTYQGAWQETPLE